MRDVCGGFNIDDIPGRVAGSLNPDELGLSFPYRTFQGIRVTGIEKIQAEAPGVAELD